MPAVTIIFPDDLLARADAIVAKRKEAATAPQKFSRYTTAEQRHKAFLIAEKKGAQMANAYLKSLRPPKPEQPSKFRMGFLLELIEAGIKLEEEQQAQSAKQ